MLFPEILKLVANRIDLDFQTSKSLMGLIMDNQLSDEQIKEIILGLKTKGEAAAEVTGFVAAMLERSSLIEVPEVCLDIVGTGGDQSGSVNISTTAALVAAATGIKVIKHGNRAASSKSGSADVLEALGIKLNMNDIQIKECADEVGIAFCFAPQFHPAMKNVAAVRKEIGLPTIFNILGPLANPAQPTSIVVGVADAARAELMAKVLSERGCVGFMVHGDDGLDEITITTTSTMWQFGKNIFEKQVFDPTEFNIPFAKSELLNGGDALENAEKLIAALDPTQLNPTVVAIRNAVILNAAAGILAHQIKVSSASQLATNAQWQEAITAAAAVINSGAALEKLRNWQKFCAAS